MKMLKSAKGFTLVEIMIVVAIIGILIAIAVPGFVKARTQSRTRACQENLTKIDGAKEQWALESKKAPGAAVVDAEVDAYIKGGRPICPASGTYAYGAIGENPTCTVATHTLTPSAAPAAGGAGP